MDRSMRQLFTNMAATSSAGKSYFIQERTSCARLSIRRPSRNSSFLPTRIDTIFNLIAGGVKRCGAVVIGAVFFFLSSAVIAGEQSPCSQYKDQQLTTKCIALWGNDSSGITGAKKVFLDNHPIDIQVSTLPPTNQVTQSAPRITSISRYSSFPTPNIMPADSAATPASTSDTNNNGSTGFHLKY